MCQLMFVNSADWYLNKTILYSMLYMDSRISNRDGFGFYNGRKVVKFGGAASLTTNLGNILNQTIDKNSGPLLGHVRLATNSIGATEKVVVPENSHPFEGKRFVLAHNGSLTLKKDKEKDFELETKTIEERKGIDSELFLNILEKNALIYKEDFVALLKRTIDSFHGKFAFLIFDKLEKNYYAARGSTALLHSANLYLEYPDKSRNKIGYVVNTDRSSLQDGLILGANYAQLFGLGKVVVDDIEELPKESIYLLDKEQVLNLNEKVEETHVPTQVVWPRSRRNDYDEDEYAAWGNTRFVNNTVYSRKPHKSKITELCLGFMRDTEITLEELDRIFYHAIGVPILDLNSSHYDLVYELFKVLRPQFAKVKAAKWEDIIHSVSMKNFDSYVSNMEIYNMFDIKFPYFLNTARQLADEVKKYENSFKQ